MMSDWIRPLSSDELAARDAGLALAARLVDSSLPLSTAHVQGLYDALLEEDLIAESEFTISAGLAYGSLFVAGGGYEWVRVCDDEYGEETCVAYIGKMIFLAPISMIQKRLNRKESLSITELVDDTRYTVESRIDAGQSADR